MVEIQQQRNSQTIQNRTPRVKKLCACGRRMMGLAKVVGEYKCSLNDQKGNCR